MRLDACAIADTRRPVTSAPVSRSARARSYRARLAVDPATRRDAYRLRYTSYRAAGHIPRDPRETFADQYDALPGSHTIVVYDAAVPVASVRVSFAGPASLSACPAAATFGEEVAACLSGTTSANPGHEGVEVNRLVRSPTVRGTEGLVFLLYRLAGHLALARDFQVVFLCARPNHVPFYARLGFRDVAGPRAYLGLSCPMRLLAATRQQYEAACRAFPMMNPAIDGPAIQGFLQGGTIDVALTGSP